MPGITRVRAGESNVCMPVTHTHAPDHTYLSIHRPRLPRTIVSSARVNLNKYWEELADHYEKRDHPAGARAPSSITNDEINDPFTGLKGTIPSSGALVIKTLLMLEQFNMGIPEK